jgi:hypothetical protein
MGTDHQGREHFDVRALRSTAMLCYAPLAQAGGVSPLRMMIMK